MTSDRPYRAAMSVEFAITTLSENAGIQFDPSIVAAFKTVLERRHARQRRVASEAEAWPASA